MQMRILGFFMFLRKMFFKKATKYALFIRLVVEGQFAKIAISENIF